MLPWGTGAAFFWDQQSLSAPAESGIKGYPAIASTASYQGELK